MKLLVALDDSEFASKALQEALALAKVKGATVTALTVVPHLGALEDVPPSVTEKMHAEAGNVIAKAKSEAEKCGIPLESAVRQGISPAETILDFAEEYSVDLIVVGHRGKTGLAKFLMGSVAQQVVAHCPCSVLVVK
ncbi:MAG: universal stress protein [Desulfovibrionaceae bacterium]